MVNHTQILNALIEKYNLKSYLEIGIFNPAHNFDKIKCEQKIGIDPAIENYKGLHKMTSDEFFYPMNNIKTEVIGGKEYKSKWVLKFNLIFIDGLHHSDQVKRDFENSLRCLTDNGFILIHDCLPEKEETTHVPRNTLVWHGDVYKFAMNIGQYAGIGYKTFNIDHGCMLVWKENKEKEFEQPFPTDWQTYLAIRKQAMNIVDKVEI